MTATNQERRDWAPSNPYRGRPRQYSGVRSIGEWRFKVYRIMLDERTASSFDAAWQLAAGALPAGATSSACPGVGFVIEHAGRGVDYFVLAWWDRENELPIRIWVREHDSSEWRAARGSESVCVWDLEVVDAERRAFVGMVLTPGGGGVDRYMRERLGDSPGAGG